ncbi:hypothetical protein [Parabacteroides sp.]
MNIEEYQKINCSFRKKLIYKVGLDCGFFSEYNNMILAMAYCLMHKIQFILSSNNANFDKENGWCGFFEPFCEDVVTNKDQHYKTVNWKYMLKILLRQKDLKILRNILPYISFGKKILYTQDVFGRSRDNGLLKKKFYIDPLKTKLSYQELCSILVNLTWKYNLDVKKDVHDLISSLGLPPEYLGFHIRGGDKFLEHQIEPIESYFAKNKTEIKNVFVLTDDFTVISDIKRKYPDYSVYTLCEESEHGYFHGDFMNQDEVYKRYKLIRLFASIDILANSKLFVGTFSSNPGMYMGMRAPSTSKSIDFDNWIIW